MLALEYRPSVYRYVATRTVRRLGAGALQLAELDPPPLPGRDWVPLHPRLSGICGSDQAMIDGHASLYLSSLTSTPFVPGHEIVAEVTAGDERGRRVVVEPALGCKARGLDPACAACSDGRPGLCGRVTDGSVAAGLQIGFCHETGGGWSEGLVAHRSQLHPVPDELDDEDAVLVEPLACGLHAARRTELAPSARAAVVGAGTIGLMTIAALRERHPDATILAVAKHRGQELEARRLGADHTSPVDRFHLEGARLTGARRLVGHGGRELLLGGFDVVVDCVGSGASLEAAVGAVRPRGAVVLVGMPSRVSADLAMAWQREIEIRGAYAYDHDDFTAALALARRLALGRLVAHGWDLRDYRRALDESRRASRAGRVKTVFDMRTAA
jgi:threonine dehydrogenase-like Zn-dependent dehydrogenase